MSIKTKIATLAIAALAVTTVATSSYAKPKINPVAAGLVGAAIVGTTIVAATQPSYGYYPRHRHCFLQPQYNMFGGFMGYAKFCEWR